MNRVKIYKDKNDDTELYIHLSYDDMYNAVVKTNWFQPQDKEYQKEFHSVCDWCAEQDTEYYYFPELGHKVSCKKCAKEHMKNVQWYVEDTHEVFNMLITFLLTYDIGLTNEEAATIDEFFGTKGHNELHILKFLYRED